MRNRRLAFAGLALATAITLTGCGPKDNATSAGAPAGTATKQAATQADPTTELAAAVAKLNQDTMRVSMTMAGSVHGGGVADPKAQTAELTMDMGDIGQGTKMQLRKVGTDIYLKIGGELGKVTGSGDKWMHLDATKLPAGSSVGMMSGDDPAGAKTLMKAVTEVKRSGDTYTGTLDLSKSPQYNSDKLKALGGKATTVPFTARVDDQGRLTELTVDMERVAAGAGQLKSTYSDFGTAVSVSRPPKSEVTELPSQLKGIFKS
ncbi:hypothetical protein [Krasilnikovia sp. MM14-A1259]|uniref:hypothetical protein n=1 Tax=Krasilnikovia sp. MM14-A1259 TaxID=3373539 RepID=UPI0038226D87